MKKLSFFHTPFFVMTTANLQCITSLSIAAECTLSVHPAIYFLRYFFTYCPV